MNSQIKDLSGMKFGRLTVVSYAGSQSGRKAMWLCKCDCGAEVVKRGDTIQTRNTGCGGPTCMRSKKNNYPSTGDKFGMLTAMSFSKTNKKGGGLYWLFQCDCGNQVSRRWHQVKTGKLDHCGCQSLKKLVTARYGKNNRSAMALIDVYKQYKSRAKAKHRDFTLSLQQFILLICSNCFYCGQPPSNTHVTRKRKFLTLPPEVTYNGIDRYDSGLGYTPENSVTACKICNYAKRDTDILTFLEWAKRVSNVFSNISVEDLDKKKKAAEKSLQL